MRARNAAQGGNSYNKKPPMEEYKLDRIINDPNKMWVENSIDKFCNKPKKTNND